MYIHMLLCMLLVYNPPGRTGASAMGAREFPFSIVMRSKSIFTGIFAAAIFPTNVSTVLQSI